MLKLQNKDKSPSSFARKINALILVVLINGTTFAGPSFLFPMAAEYIFTYACHLFCHYSAIFLPLFGLTGLGCVVAFQELEPMYGTSYK
jgi:hypothetical protein